MAKGYGGGMAGGMNMNNMLKQAQKMQKQMEQVQADVETRTLEVSAGGGAIKIVINGKKLIQDVQISPDVIDPDDIETLQDLVMAAVNEAIRQADEMVSAEMSKVMPGGMGLPGGLF